jgi:16S rRNA (guanine527-N7)-methyltransferase
MVEQPAAAADLLQQLFSAADRPLDARRQQQFLSYMRELQHWNRTLSLTSIADDAGIIRKHFLGSLDFLRAFIPQPGQPLLDVGTGAGFPGLPLKLWHPELAVDLVESSQRKAVFLQHLCRVLGLADVRCLSTRVEELAQDETRRARYAVIVSRGVGGVRRWLPAALALLQVGGQLVLEKGPTALAEVQSLAPSLPAYGGALLDLIPIPGESSTARTLVVIRKPCSGEEWRGQKFDKHG